MICSDKLSTIYGNNTNKYEFCVRLLQVIKIFEVVDDYQTTAYTIHIGSTV